MASPNLTQTSNNDERQEGDIQVSEALALDLEEEDIIRVIGSRVEESERFWNTKLDLDNVRDRNEKYWLNQHINEKDLHDFQVPYKDPRIFTAIESLIPMALAKPPQPLITEAFNTDASRELASNLQDALLAYYEDNYMKKDFLMVARHLLTGQRLGVMKYRWDQNKGDMLEDGSYYGEVAVDVIRPKRIVLDEGANDPDDIPLIGEYCIASVEQLVQKFPKRKDKIMQYFQTKEGGKVKLSKKEGYVEVWFTYWQGGQKREGVAWKVGGLYLGAMKNPNFNYDDPNGNFFDCPKKPYILCSHLNLGKYVIDDTSLTEQASNQQDILDKRGRQIIENADSANSGTIFNSDMITQESVAQLIGDPNEKAMVKGDVMKAAMRLPTNILPPYVMQDKQDARDEIDNIFGTHSPLRGDPESKTLGQDVLSQRSDISRIMPLANSLEDGADRLYKGIVQMWKVFKTDPQTIKYMTPEGKTTFIENFSGRSIEGGISVRVKSGSVMPEDPMAKMNQTIQLLPILDPLSIAEGIGAQDPKEQAKRILLFRMAPDKYFSEILNEDPMAQGNAQDPKAMQEQQMMMQGRMDVPPQQSPSKAHLATHQAFLDSPEFAQAPPETQQFIVEHIKVENENAKIALGQPSPAEQPAEAMPPDGAGVPAAPQEQPTPFNDVPPNGLMKSVQALGG